jgi:hypothetical protein
MGGVGQLRNGTALAGRALMACMQANIKATALGPSFTNIIRLVALVGHGNVTGVGFQSTCPTTYYRSHNYTKTPTALIMYVYGG